MPVSVTVYHKSRFCPSLMCIQHSHMVCGELHICHDLVLNQNINYNAYSTPFLHGVLDVDHKMVMLGIIWYHNTFPYLCVQHQNYSEHDTLCLSIFFYSLFSFFYLINDSIFTIIHRFMVLEFLSQTDIFFLSTIMH